jgi:hypothetical protein
MAGAAPNDESGHRRRKKGGYGEPRGPFHPGDRCDQPSDTTHNLQKADGENATHLIGGRL